MRHNSFRRIFHSVFAQLLLICLVAGLVIILLVGGFFAHVFRKSAHLHLQRNVTQYLNYVVKDLGTPPSLERARKIARDSGLQIRFESPEGGWSTSDKIPILHELGGENLPQDQLSIRGIHHDNYPILIKQGTGAFVFILKPEHTMESGWEKWTALLIVLLTSVVVLTYLAVRHILNPLKFLAEGVQQVSNGNLDYQVPHWRSAEFDQLAEGFNTMTVRIRNMLYAKEQLLLDVSHELRSPLTRMKVALEMVADARVKEPLTDDIREMETMVSEILEAARLRNVAGELKIEAIPAKILFQEIGELYQNQPPGLLIDPLPDDAIIQGDLMLIKIVFNNIITNAIKYSPADGEAVRLSFRQHEGYAIVQVKDHGHGIPGEDLPYIFEPFYRVDKSRSKRTGGYGLGLSLCKTIMDAHQGRIEVESTLGVGTTTSLYFKNSG
ncbi:MAG: integral membrane sensor signal transduction histidine [Geobacteraceae bacterium]|nr:MAG: integral membrane sensor signal transduction histidine [Geobacteraceae bacterium]